MKPQSPGAVPRRGEIRWVRLDRVLGSEIRKTRPCLILTSDIANQLRRTVVVIPLSSSPQASPPLLIPVQCAGRKAVVVTDQIRAIEKERLGNLVNVLSAKGLRAVEEALREVPELR